MKPTTIFLSKIWAFAFISSIIFKCVSPDNINHTNTIKLILKWFIFLLPSLFAFIKFGNAIFTNSAIDKNLDYKKELFKLALFISTIIWMIDFFIFTLMRNVSENHFYTIPFFFALIFGIYFFNKKEEKSFIDEQILDDNINFDK